MTREPAAPSTTSAALIAAEADHLARNYHPLPVVIATGEGTWVTDVDGHRYLDFLSAYSALNFGHRHRALVAAAQQQLERVTLTSRAFHNDQLGPFSAALAKLTGLEAVLPMNTGAEAVETAIKVARKWGYERKGVRTDSAEIITFRGNFHGRTTTIVSFSDDPSARQGFGPFTPGFIEVPFGDADALAAAISDCTVGVLVEPIQGEAGVIVPPAHFLRAVRELCSAHQVLLIADEAQSGLGRTGRTFACEHEAVVPDIYVLGKALGGGIVPASAVVSSWDVLGVLNPGEHGSTFGGNPLAAAVGRAVVELLEPGELQARSARLGEEALTALRDAALPGVREVRGLGLWWAVELEPGRRTGRDLAEELLRGGLLAKDTHGWTLRFAPPLTITEPELAQGLEIITSTIAR